MEAQAMVWVRFIAFKVLLPIITAALTLYCWCVSKQVRKEAGSLRNFWRLMREQAKPKES